LVDQQEESPVPIINWEMTDPATRTRRIVAIEITAQDGRYDFEACFTDDPTKLIASAGNVSGNETEALALAKKLVMDARTI
jgi:F420-dependent methylenetetrahydromethanopterin dehydrogenase